MKFPSLLACLSCACALAFAVSAPAQGTASALASAGAASAMAQGEGELRRGQIEQQQVLDARARDERKAKEDTARGGLSKAPQSGSSEKTPSTPVAANGWRFSTNMTVLVSRPGGGAIPETDPAADDARAILMKLRAPTSEALMEEAKKTMYANGYYLYHPLSWRTNAVHPGQLDLTVDFGHVHVLTTTFAPTNWPGDKQPPTEGRYFSREQIETRYMRGVATSNIFNYNTLYSRFYALNAHPDLTGTLRLHAVTNGAGTVEAPDVRRLEMKLNIVEKCPLHGVFAVDNNGTDAADNWMGRVTLQYLNLWKSDGVATVSYQNSLADMDALGGLAGSYYQPFTVRGHDSALTLYGGWTDVNSEDVVPEIDVEGMGWYAGLQLSSTMWENELRSLRGSVGLVRRYVEDNLVVQGQRLDGNDVTVMPFTLSLMYSDKEQDAWKGMNFATAEVLAQFGDFLGTSDEEEMHAQRRAADKDYTVLHLQLARLQMLPLLSLSGKPESANPMLFARVNGQIASGALIPAEQFGLGGDGSVRGYASREYLGDHGVSGTLELRVPIFLGLLDWKTGPSGAPWDRWQAVAFFDAGYVKIEDPLPGEEADKTLCGAGAGVRLALTDYFQVKCDVAFPLEKTADSDSLCVHFSAQAQF